MANFDPIKQFNSGKGFAQAPQGSIDEGEFLFYIQSVELQKSQFKDKNGEDQYQMVLNICLDDPDSKISDKDLFTRIYQTVKFTPNGAMKNPAYPEFTTKNGTTIPASQLWDILAHAEFYDGDAYKKARDGAEDKDGTVNWAKFLTGLKFEYDARIGDKKDGTGKYVILLTPKQLLKDEEYRNSRNAPADDDVVDNSLPVNEPVVKRRGPKDEIVIDPAVDLPF